MKNNSHPKTQVSESLVREVLTSYNKHKSEYRLNTLLRLTPDEIIEHIVKDLNDKSRK